MPAVETLIVAAAAGGAVGAAVTHALSNRRAIRESQKEAVTPLDEALPEMKLHVRSTGAPWPATGVQSLVDDGQRALVRADGRLGHEHPVVRRTGAAMAMFDLGTAVAAGHAGTYDQCLAHYMSDAFDATRTFHRMRRVQTRDYHL